MALWLAKLIERPTNKGRAVVKGKRVNKEAGYGLEIPWEYRFTGDEFSIQWLTAARLAQLDKRRSAERRPLVQVQYNTIQ